jgi:hypothetical protein
MDNDIEIFKGKKFSDLCKDIVENSEHKRNQLDILVSDLRGLLKGINDAITIVPLIREYLDVGVRNDEQLVKLAAIVQRLMKAEMAPTENGPGGFALSDAERKQLLTEAEDIVKSSKKPVEVKEVKVES